MVTSGGLYTTLKEYQKDNYFLKNEQGNALVPEKIGNAWEQLEKGGKVEINENTYRDLKSGIDPNTGGQMAQDGVNGEHRAGTNFTFSPDKSWTVYAHTSETAMKDVKGIHEAAMRDVIKYMEENLIQARQTTDGVTEPVKTNSMLAMLVNHQVSNAGDVQLHAHLVCYNETYNKETGKWQALHNDPLHSDILNKLYENGLAHYGKEAGLAVGWKDSDTGKTQYATLKGGEAMDKAVEATSTRAKAIDAYFEAHKEELHAKYPGQTIGDIKQAITNQTRNDKVSMTKEQIDARFTGEIAGAGISLFV